MANMTSGQCLTAENWQEVGVNTASFSLASLLIKPGLDYLKSLSKISQFTGWSGKVFLDASAISFNRNGVFKSRSPYDGSKLELTSDDMLKLCIRLQPDFVLLPEHISMETIQKYQWDKTKVYSAGDNIPEIMNVDTAVEDALKGTLYSNDGNINISEAIYAEQMQILSEECTCPTCAQEFTRAYLHHLFSQTPLLCQRYLIQHNVYSLVQ